MMVAITCRDTGGGETRRGVEIPQGVRVNPVDDGGDHLQRYRRG